MNTDAGQYRERIPRWLFMLIAALLVVGAILSWWGTRAKRVFHSGPRAEAILSGRVPAAKPSFSLDQTLTQGRQLNTTYCAGCHAEQERLIGPSYHLITASYRALQGRLGGGAAICLPRSRLLPGSAKISRGGPRFQAAICSSTHGRASWWA